MSGKRRTAKKSPIITLLLLAAAVVLAVTTRTGILTEKPTSVIPADSEIVIHFIDVGQGNSTLIQSGTSGVLIDAGEAEYGRTVCDYIEACGVTKLEEVIATHPHSDHIGGMTQVLEHYPADTLFAPELPASLIPTTRVYENLLDIISEKGIDAVYTVPESAFTLGAAQFEILGPVRNADNLNNMSVITRMTFGETDVLFVGDAETEEMKSLCAANEDFSADIYLMGHHGSRTSVNESFLKLVEPTVAVISCGADNSYGHPHEEAIDYLESNSIKYYRTDLNGNIVITCTADGYTVKTQK